MNTQTKQAYELIAKAASNMEAYEAIHAGMAVSVQLGIKQLLE